MGRLTFAAALLVALVAVSGAASSGNPQPAPGVPLGAPQAQARITGTIGGRAIDLTRPAPSHW